MGRKKLTPAKKRSKPLKIMTTIKERDEIDRAAIADEMETSTWVRRKILEAIRGAVSRPMIAAGKSSE